MAKKESTLINMLMSLTVVTLVASTALGFVYELTKAPIAAAKLAKKISAIDQVVDEYENNPVDDMFKLSAGEGEDSVEVYPAKKSDQIGQYAVRSYSNKGYGGRLWLMVGIDPDGTIHDIAVLEHKETPGLGTKMSEPEFIGQFQGVDPGEVDLAVKKDGGEIDALTGATITSQAFSDATQRAYETIQKVMRNE